MPIQIKSLRNSEHEALEMEIREKGKWKENNTEKGRERKGTDQMEI